MYEQLLFIHSWTRWAVFLSILYFFIKATNGWVRHIKWTPDDGHVIWAFEQVFGYQILFGLTLWLGLSPMTKIGFKDSAQILSNPSVFFWTLRHPLTMLLTFGIFLIGRARAKRTPAESKNKIFSLTFGILLALIISAIPWPWLGYGRSLFRWLT